MDKSEANQVTYELDNTKRYPLWMNFVTILILLAFMIVGSVCYFLLLNKLFGEVTFSIVTFLIKCLIVYLLSVFMHEMGHLFMAKRSGYQFRIFKAGGILAFNNSFKNLTVNPSQFLSGGFVLFNFNETITSIKKFDKFIKNDFKYMALGGMFANSSLVIIGILLLFQAKTFELGYLFVCFNMMILLAQLLHPSDLTKYWFIKKNPKKAAIVFTEELSINRKVNGFLEELFHSYIEEALSSKMFDQHLLVIIQRVIEYHLIHHQENSKELHRFIIWFSNHFDQILTMGLAIRIAAGRLMHMLIEYNLIDSKDISMHKLSPIIHKHSFHFYYSNFFGYRRRLVELETIRKERETNGLPF